MLSRIAACGNGAKQKNASRNLHSLIVRQGRSLRVPVTYIKTPVRLVRGGRPQFTDIDFPVLLPSSWLRLMLTYCPEVILGGHPIEEVDDWGNMFANFWHHFNQSMPGVQMNGASPEVNIPVCIHGDEGRGKTRKPIMIIAWQALIGSFGPLVTNLSGMLGYTAMCTS